MEGDTVNLSHCTTLKGLISGELYVFWEDQRTNWLGPELLRKTRWTVKSGRVVDFLPQGVGRQDTSGDPVATISGGKRWEEFTSICRVVLQFRPNREKRSWDPCPQTQCPRSREGRGGPATYPLTGASFISDRSGGGRASPLLSPRPRCDRASPA